MRNHIKGKTVLITGASSGIGYACAVSFAEMGAKLILCARRADKLATLEAELIDKHKTQVFTCMLDVTKSSEVNDFIASLPQEFKSIDILVNNAGLASGLDEVVDADLVDLDIMVDTNLKGMVYMTKAILPMFIVQNSGQVINIGSISGLYTYSKSAVYCATKAAVHMFTRGLREECVKHNIKITEVMPGAVNTEFSTVRFHGDKDRADSIYNGFTPLVAEDVADLVLYSANLPAHVNIAETLILPTAQARVDNIFRQNS